MRGITSDPTNVRCDRAERDRQICSLEKEIAFRTSASIIETSCPTVRHPDIVDGSGQDYWLDTARADSDRAFGDAFRYLDLRRLLIRHPSHPHLVRVKARP